MERNEKGIVTVEKMYAKIPDDQSILSIFATNNFITQGDYRKDGFIYINNKPVKKWFKKVENVLVWFPILEDIKKLQDRFYRIKETYRQYLEGKYRDAVNKLSEIKTAHTMITHKFNGNNDPWWLFVIDEQGINWDWVKEPREPKNLDIGNAYYKRLDQLGQRVHTFRMVLHRAIENRIIGIEGYNGQLLQLKVDDKIYWFQYGRYSWEKLAFPENTVKFVEI